MPPTPANDAEALRRLQRRYDLFAAWAMPYLTHLGHTPDGNRMLQAVIAGMAESDLKVLASSFVNVGGTAIDQLLHGAPAPAPADVARGGDHLPPEIEAALNG